MGNFNISPFLMYINDMSWECKYLRETFCDKRKQECCPGAKGCVLEGRFSFPLRPSLPEKSPKKNPKKK